MKNKNNNILLFIIILGIITYLFSIHTSVNVIIPKNDLRVNLVFKTIFTNNINRGSIISSTFFPFDNIVTLLILFLIGLSLILYVLINNVLARKKLAEIQLLKEEDEEEIIDHELIGKFEVYKDKAGKFRFRLKASNGEIIAVASQGYSTKQSCLNGIRSVKMNAADATIIEL